MGHCAEFEVDGEDVDFIIIERPHVVVCWQSVVRHILRVRRLQRIWANLGLFLKDSVSKHIRESLKSLKFA
jgi:hypothetical protein